MQSNRIIYSSTNVYVNCFHICKCKAGVLKLYFRELPDPVVPEMMYSAFLDVEKLGKSLEEKLEKYVHPVNTFVVFLNSTPCSDECDVLFDVLTDTDICFRCYRGRTRCCFIILCY